MEGTDSLRLVENVKKRLVALALSQNFVREKQVADACRAVWSGPGEEGGLVSELWVEGAFTAELSGDTLQSLADASVVDRKLVEHLDRPQIFPAQRPLYRHQAETVRRSTAGTNEKPALVVSAGTGSGKTEAFLLPILNDLWRNPRTSGYGGMRCLMLYPMNALVADQVERVDRWLAENAPGLCVFHFTSETPNDNRTRVRCGEPESTPWRQRTREEARENAPDIVITNYSMLEYMLCRPQDNPFFGPNLRAIVLDEAHLYAGVLAAEITLLLRRVRLRCGVRPEQLLQIATSATLGGDEADLRDFAATVFSTKPANTFVVFGQKAAPTFQGNVDPAAPATEAAILSKHADVELRTLTAEDKFANDTSDSRRPLRDALKTLLSEQAIDGANRHHQLCSGPFLFEALSSSPLVRQVANKLHAVDGAIALKDLAEEIFSANSTAAQRATIALLRLSASAREQPNLPPLIPHRLHFLTRAPEGLCACLDPECSGPDEKRLPGFGCLQPISECCRYCEASTLAVHRCDVCGEWAFAALESPATMQLRLPLFESPGERRYYLGTDARSKGLSQTIVDPRHGDQLGDGAEGLRLFRAPCPKHGAECLDMTRCSGQKCPRCEVEWSVRGRSDEDDEGAEDVMCKPFRGSETIARSVLAETLLAGMPTFPDTSRAWKPGKGRRLLCFSDSRREAARLGPQLTRQHETWLVRAAITDAIGKLGREDLAEDVKNEIEELKHKLSDSDLSEPARVRLKRQLEERHAEYEQARSGMPFSDFARLVCKDPRLDQIFDRELGEKHQADTWNQAGLKDNRIRVAKHAEALLATELNRRLPTKFSLESVGVVEVVYPSLDRVRPPAKFLGTAPSHKLREALDEGWPDYLAALLDTLRFDGAAGWSEGDDVRSEHKWEDESPLLNRWAARDSRGWNSIRFVGASKRQLRQLRLWFTAQLLERAGCPAPHLSAWSSLTLGAAFDSLFRAASDGKLPWLAHEPTLQINQEGLTQKAVKIQLDQLSIRQLVRPFSCPDSLTLWPRSVLGWAPLRGCRGGLERIDADKVNEHPRWRREYEELGEPVFRMGLWAEEHSAQLGPRDNRRLQELFRAGVRNILSSTTTMELGIDIGGLNGVLLSNTPPSLANHRQRAGRAGRRADGSSLVATFARARPFDREVFGRFGDFLGQKLRRPVVHLKRQRVVRRHLHALLLGEFFRREGLQGKWTGAMDAYSQMGSFCCSRPPPWWEQGDFHKPLRLKLDGEALDKRFMEWLREPSDPSSEEVVRTARVLTVGTILEGVAQDDQAWKKLLDEATEAFKNAVGPWRKDVERLQAAWEAVESAPPTTKSSRARNEANAIRYQIKLLCETTVIEWLADQRVLPRYGFPINLQRLEVRQPDQKRPDRSRRDERFRLERSSLLALAEYVPGAQVLVGGKTATSRGLLKYWTEATRDQALGREQFLIECPAGHSYRSDDQEALCPECQGEPKSRQLLLFPRFGYVTAAWEPLKRSGGLARVGETEVYPTEAFLGGTEPLLKEPFGEVPGLRASYYEESELLLHNKGADRAGFAICTRCGFAMSERQKGEGREGLPPRLASHGAVFSPKEHPCCWNKTEAPVLRNRTLAARERTDLIVFQFSEGARTTESATVSLGRALVMAGARLLEVDSREIDARAKPAASQGRFDLIVFDAGSSAAGHCLEIFKRGKEWFQKAGHILKGDEDHHRRCKRACLDCILDFSGQFSGSKLDRRAALNLLD